MKLIYDIIMGFVAFSAVVVLFASLTGLAIWLLVAFAKALEPDDTHHSCPFSWLASMIGFAWQFPIGVIRVSRPGVGPRRP
jgi:hypothetical protein